MNPFEVGLFSEDDAQAIVVPPSRVCLGFEGVTKPKLPTRSNSRASSLLMTFGLPDSESLVNTLKSPPTTKPGDSVQGFLDRTRNVSSPYALGLAEDPEELERARTLR